MARKLRINPKSKIRSSKPTRAAVFLDRDGVINENREHYVRSWEQVQLLPGTLAALARLARTDYAIVVVTNQSGIRRGLIEPDTAQEINDRLVACIQQAAGRIEALYLCPHTPGDNCECRKPKPGLLFRAARELNLDLTNSWLVGDSMTDLQAGIAASVRPILVRTGRGATEAPLCAAHGLTSVQVLADLAAAVDYVLTH